VADIQAIFPSLETPLSQSIINSRVRSAVQDPVFSVSCYAGAMRPLQYSRVFSFSSLSAPAAGLDRCWSNEGAELRKSTFSSTQSLFHQYPSGTTQRMGTSYGYRQNHLEPLPFDIRASQRLSTFKSKLETLLFVWLFHENTSFGHPLLSN
jgi:hypothetical protein